MADAPARKDLRAYPRRRLHALVRVEEDDTLIMPALNISLGGVLLGMTVATQFKFPVASRHPLTLFDPADSRITPVAMIGRVVRHSANGLAMQWVELAPDARGALERLMLTLKPLDE